MKQYLLMVTEDQVAFLNRVMPSIQFVEVIGADMKDDPNHQVLLNPKPLTAQLTEEQMNTPMQEVIVPPTEAPTEDVVPAIEEVIPVESIQPITVSIDPALNEIKIDPGAPEKTCCANQAD